MRILAGGSCEMRESPAECVRVGNYENELKINNDHMIWRPDKIEKNQVNYFTDQTKYIAEFENLS